MTPWKMHSVVGTKASGLTPIAVQLLPQPDYPTTLHALSSKDHWNGTLQRQRELPSLPFSGYAPLVFARTEIGDHQNVPRDGLFVRESRNYVARDSRRRTLGNRDHWDGEPV